MALFNQERRQERRRRRQTRRDNRKEKRIEKLADKFRNDEGIGRLLNKLEPLRKAMRTLLSRKGVATAPNINMFDLALVFAENVIGGEAGAKAAEIRRLAAKGFTGDVIIHDAAGAILASIAAIVGGIVTFFKELKSQRDQGNLTPDQEKIVDQVEEGVDAAQRGRSRASGDPGVFVGGQNRGIVLLAAAGAAAYLILKK